MDKKRGRGQPTLLTPEIIEDTRRILPTVMYMETVGDYLGVSRITWRGWLKRGSKEARRVTNAKTEKGREPKPSEALYLEFFYTFKKGLAEGEIFATGIIKKAASPTVAETTKITNPDGTVTEKTKYHEGQWQAAAWLNERRFPERWGRYDRTPGDDGKGSPTVLNVSILNVDAPQQLPKPIPQLEVVVVGDDTQDGQGLRQAAALPRE